MTIEEALDWFRAEGGWEPVPNPGPQPPKVGTAPKFVSQCNRCLDFVQAARKELGARSRTWLCAACDGPNPKAVVVPKSQTFWEWLREGREVLKAAEKEAKKRAREEAREKRAADLSRVREERAAKRDAKNASTPCPTRAVV